MSEDQVKTKTLYKALKLLDCFTIAKPELGVTELADMLGLYKSNVHNMADTFVKAGYLERNSETGKYRLSYKVLRLSHVISSTISFRKTIFPYMQEMADTTGETLYLAIAGEDEVIYLDSASPRNQFIVKTVLGVRAPLYCTGIGKAMLAFLPETVVNAVLEQTLERFTDFTITSAEQLRRQLLDIRKRGYAVDHMEHQFGVKCVGVPLLNKQNEVVAGISISGPSLRFGEEQIEQYARRMQQMTMELAEKI